MAHAVWQRSQAAHFKLPDGSTVRVGGEVDVSGPWSCLFKAVVDGKSIGCTVAQSGTVDRFVEHKIGVPKLESRPFRGGTVRSIVDPANGERVHAWTGPWWEIQYGDLGRRPDIGSALSIFEAMKLRDTPEGLVIGAWGQTLKASTCTVFKAFSKIGELRIDRPNTAISLPAWRGRSTRAGEVWAQNLGAEGHGRARQTALILGTETAVGRLVADPDSTANDSTALAMMDSLELQWS